MIGAEGDPLAAYLDAEALIAVAVEAGCDCVHPGYGFLAENAGFASRCADAGITFVGPSPETLSLFGDKVAARALARSLGVAVVEGSAEAVATAADAAEGAARIGYPVMLKAAAGGGGRGMRAVEDPADMAEAFARCRSEAQAAFGDGALFLERLLPRPRHIEVQILADAHGGVVHLLDRDCSVQLRNQKVVEVAPAPALDPATRQQLFDSAIALAKATDYVNAGTVEFLVSPERGEHAFIECNPRIQVEHTVTEQVTGVDLVEAQFRIAGGASLADLGIGDQDRHHRPRVRRPGACRRHRRRHADRLPGAFRTGRARRRRRLRRLRAPPQFDPLLAKVIGSSPSPDVAAAVRPHPARRRGVPHRRAADQPGPAAGDPRSPGGARR